ncbi:MAG: hypothetical protein N2322_00635 [Terrimicrobiaceae bacterium]|nr:hypothetical protein [Terrimicrobiaceae bacterium]
MRGSSLLDRLEKKLGRFAIPGLIRYITALNALVYLLVLASPGYREILELDRGAILRGEVWRLITWIFLPNTLSPLWIFFYLMFTWWVGEMLEGAWGAFRLNAYSLLGAAAGTASAMLLGASGGNFLLSLSLLLAIATIAPDEQVLLLVFPVKLKWIALLSLIYPWGLLLLIGPLPVKAMIIVCLANYFLFFGTEILAAIRRIPAATGRGSRAARPFASAKQDAVLSQTLHCCAACGATEVTHPEAEFRVAADGREFCLPCLRRSRK